MPANLFPPMIGAGSLGGHRSTQAIVPAPVPTFFAQAQPRARDMARRNGLGLGLLNSPFVSTGRSYSTTFSGTETILSEGGVWTTGGTTGIDWTNPTMSGGFAFGTQSSGSSAFDDSTAVLSGFAANHYCSAVIHRSATSLSGNTHECELLLRTTISSHSQAGYECNLAWDGGYAQLVRLRGAIGTQQSDFPLFDLGNIGIVPADGDLFEAQIVGSVVNTWLTHGGTRTPLFINQDVTSLGTVYSTGNPGIGFWHSDSSPDYCFTSFAANDL
jgi:hypothetical protein